MCCSTTNSSLGLELRSTRQTAQPSKTLERLKLATFVPEVPPDASLFLLNRGTEKGLANATSCLLLSHIAQSSDAPPNTAVSIFICGNYCCLPPKGDWKTAIVSSFPQHITAAHDVTLRSCVLESQKSYGGAISQFYFLFYNMASKHLQELAWIFLSVWSMERNNTAEWWEKKILNKSTWGLEVLLADYKQDMFLQYQLWNSILYYKIRDILYVKLFWLLHILIDNFWNHRRTMSASLIF